MPLPVTLSEVIQSGIQSAMDELHTSGPGKVLKYDPVLCVADIQPLWRRRLYDADGNSVFSDMPVIPSVPIQWPRSGGYVMTFPILPDDFVTLIFPEVATGEIHTDGQIAEPLDARRHSIGSAIAIPGGYPDLMPLSPADATARLAGMVLGLDGLPQQIHIDPAFITLGSGAVDYVALASFVDARILAIVTAFNAHVHPTGVGPSGPPTPISAQLPVGSLIVKCL